MTFEDGFDPYVVLGLSRDADAAAVKRAFRRLSRQVHPDLAPGREEEAKAASRAYMLLSDPAQRARFDRERRVSPQRPRGRDVLAQVVLTLRESLKGARVQAVASLGSPCPGCSASATPCRACSGTGAASWRGSGSAPCALCCGARTLGPGCSGCAGQGRVVRTAPLTVSVPAGSGDGCVLRLPGAGEPGPGGAGDAVVAVSVLLEPGTRLAGRDVHVSVPLSVAELVCGAAVSVPGPLTALPLTVPAGSRPGDQLVLAGRGLPGPDRSGDLVAHLELHLPAPGTPEAARYAPMVLAGEGERARRSRWGVA